jgi:hypothetical protein
MNAASTHPLVPRHNRQRRRRLVVADAAVHTVWNIAARHHRTAAHVEGGVIEAIGSIEVALLRLLLIPVTTCYFYHMRVI